MSAILSNKSDDEIRLMLEDYGIKHGPVVDTTRQLYEKKLREAMANARKARPRPPMGRSVYREEEEDSTFERHHPRYRDEDFNRSPWRYRDMDDIEEYRAQAAYRYTSQSFPASSRWGTSAQVPTQVQEKKASPHWVPLWIKLLVFISAAAILVLILTWMEPAETEPFKRLN